MYPRGVSCSSCFLTRKLILGFQSVPRSQQLPLAHGQKLLYKTAGVNGKSHCFFVVLCVHYAFCTSRNNSAQEGDVNSFAFKNVLTLFYEGILPILPFSVIFGGSLERETSGALQRVFFQIIMLSF